jgi:hypothetical protein
MLNETLKLFGAASTESRETGFSARSEGTCRENGKADLLTSLQPSDACFDNEMNDFGKIRS